MNTNENPESERITYGVFSLNGVYGTMLYLSIFLLPFWMTMTMPLWSLPTGMLTGQIPAMFFEGYFQLKNNGEWRV